MVVQASAKAFPIGSLSDRAMLVSMPIGMWTGVKSDRRARDAAASGTGADAASLNASKHLIAEDVIKRIAARRAFYKSEWRRLTAPWFDDGTRICLGSGFVKLKALVSTFQDEWNALIADFIQQYPYLRENARVSLGPLFDINEYPDPNRIKERFTFGFIAWNLPDPNVTPDWRADGVSQADLDAIRADAETAMRDTLAAAQADAWKRLREPIAHMAESLHNYTGGQKGSFQHTLVGNIVKVLEILPDINLTQDASLDGIAAIARQLCLYDVDTLRKDDAARDDTAALADAITAQIDQFI